MDIAIGAGLALFGNKLNNNKYVNEIEKNQIKNVPDYLISQNQLYVNNFDSDIVNSSRKTLYDSISYAYKDSEEPGSNMVNNIWRIQNDNINKIKNKENINIINKDINMIKNITSNNIETMNNINVNNGSDSDSVFSDNFSLPNYNPGMSNNNSRSKSRSKTKSNLNDNITYNSYYKDQSSYDYSSDGSDDSSGSSYSGTDSDSDSNVNLRVMKVQDKFLSDVISNLSGKSTGLSKNSEDNVSQACDSFSRQFDQLEFDHEGIPGTLPGSRQVLNLFNDKMKFNPQSNFNPKGDGRYGVTSDMTHNNMTPFFKSNTYGFNPMFDQEQTNYAVRKIELFTGSDQNPQFRHKAEVKQLFSPETNKVDSVTGVPNFSDFFESRYIPSDKRQSEKPFQPVRVTPGLNLGYNEMGNTGFQDLYRVLPKNVDQLRTVDNPKVSYQPPVIQGQMGDRRGAIGELIQKGPDRFYYNTPDSLLPQKGDFIAPAIYGKHLKRETNRSMAPDNIHLNPAGESVSKNTPEYLQGQFKHTSKRTFDFDGPRNIQYDTRGQIINQQTYVPRETTRQDTNWGDKWIGTGGNKQQDYLANYENFTPNVTTRDTTSTTLMANPEGNFKAVPLANYMNYIPETTLRQIIIEDNGKRNLTNISNSIKSYLFNSINAIPDENLRSILTEKIILTNVRENSERGYLFNAQNAIQDPNQRNMTEDNLILGVLSNKEQGYLFNNLNAIPDTNLRELVNTLYERGGMGYKGNHDETYAFNYENGTPQTNMRNLTQDQKYIVGTQGNHQEQYAFNYENGTPQTNMRNITQDQKYIVGTQGNHQEQYVFNYENGTPQTNMRNLTENQKHVIGAQGNRQEQYAFNYENGTPQTNMRNLSENQKHVIGTQGNRQEVVNFNYENGTPDVTMRQFTGPQQNITGTQGNKFEQYNFNYENGVPDATMRVFTGPQKNITGSKGNYSKQIGFNYDDIPDPTMRNLSEVTKNIVGTKGDGTQSRSQLDAYNMYLNTEKEVIAQGRDPVPVKDNRGPTTQFTEYVFCDDSYQPQHVYSNYRPLSVVQNDLYSFSQY